MTTQSNLTKEQAFWIVQYFASKLCDSWYVDELEEAILEYVKDNKGPVVKNKEREEAKGFTYNP